MSISDRKKSKNNKVVNNSIYGNGGGRPLILDPINGSSKDEIIRKIRSKYGDRENGGTGKLKAN